MARVLPLLKNTTALKKGKDTSKTLKRRNFYSSGACMFVGIFLPSFSACGAVFLSRRLRRSSRRKFKSDRECRANFRGALFIPRKCPNPGRTSILRSLEEFSRTIEPVDREGASHCGKGPSQKVSRIFFKISHLFSCREKTSKSVKNVSDRSFPETCPKGVWDSYSLLEFSEALKERMNLLTPNPLLPRRRCTSCRLW